MSNDKLRDALEKARQWHNGDKWRNGNAEERAAWEAHRDLLDEAIAASKQEPHKAAAMLEAQQPALKPLTEGQIWSLIEYNRAGSLGLARLIERAHGIKEQA